MTSAAQPTGSVTVGGRRYAKSPSPLTEVGVLLDAKAVHTGRSARAPVARQASRFVLLYALLALLHGLVLYLWTDRLGFDYRIGFLLATGMQLVLSYLGNKIMVFAA